MGTPSNSWMTGAHSSLVETPVQAISGSPASRQSAAASVALHRRLFSRCTIAFAKRAGAAKAYQPGGVCGGVPGAIGRPG